MISSYNQSISKIKLINRYKAIYAMMIPGILFIILMRYVPMSGLVIAFQKFSLTKGLFGSKYVGFDNFISFWESTFFWNAFSNTLIINSLKLAVSYPASIILALLLNELFNVRYKKFVQTLSFLPYFLSWVIISMFAYGFLSSDFGYLNVALKSLGLQPHDWYLMPDIWRGILVGTNVWKNVGFGCIFYLAAISSIGVELYEAAYIDGASRWQRVRHITIPSLSYMLLIVLILNISFMLVADFEQIYAMTGTYPILRDKTSVLSTAVYELGLKQGNFGQASAIGLFNSLLMSAMLVGSNLLTKVIMRNKNAGIF